MPESTTEKRKKMFDFNFFFLLVTPAVEKENLDKMNKTVVKKEEGNVMY